LILLDWTHRQWRHHSSNKPSQSDALTILKEVKEGKRFRCVEYGIVSAQTLLAVGVKARILGLKTKDVETAKTPPGHFLAEVWLSDLKKWALIDGQFNVMPVLDGVPLNAVEFQKAIVENKAFKLVNLKGEIPARKQKYYVNFVGPYLYYFDTRLDARPLPFAERLKVDGKASLMLIPAGAKAPTVFQGQSAIDYCLYTSSVGEFYSSPK